MTRSTCIGFLSLRQFTGPEGRELLDLINRWMARHGHREEPEVHADEPSGDAIGIYWIRAVPNHGSKAS